MSESFGALGNRVTEFRGLETFPNPGCHTVELTSDEVTANCPVTNQPDWYTVSVRVRDARECIESKTFKLFMHSFRQRGIFCEALAVEIAKTVYDAVKSGEKNFPSVSVTVSQKSRGGVSIRAVCNL